jgi:hypothetical protein
MICSPEFLTGGGVVSGNPLGTRHDCLLGSVDVNDDGCAIGFSVFTISGTNGWSVGFPDIFSGVKFNRNDLLQVGSIANDDDIVIENDG